MSSRRTLCQVATVQMCSELNLGEAEQSAAFSVGQFGGHTTYPVT